ncbi:MAG: MotA/TolQ/ExbB proton channel family protein [Candidatus Krumholzibacteria bacterium]|nr:MotA/TolQ/ExbB proton channel family protein [Candidatus Krumholzibacteria bacterium]
MGFAGIPVFLQIAQNITELIAQSGTLAKTILVILLVLSVVSWTIMVEKFRYFRRAARQTMRFRELFESEKSLDRLVDKARAFPDSPDAQLVRSVGGEAARGEIGALDHLEGYLDASMESIMSDWESYLIFLSTTATVSPFLGLLGTVWGIMSSFLSMGLRGSANLYVVGPGIADALITTVFGLGAAIPAVVGYNYILRLIRRREEQTGSFIVRFRSRLLEGRYAELAPGAAARAAKAPAVPALDR